MRMSADPNLPEGEDIPEFLKRKEVPMTSTSTAKVKAKATPAAVKAKPIKPEKAAKAVAEKATKTKTTEVAAKLDAFGYREGSVKSKAAAIYASKKGATVDEVKKATGSVQLNLLKELEADGFKVQRLKEDGPGKRQVTRYFLSAKK
jgi:sRNA-binding protein